MIIGFLHCFTKNIGLKSMVNMDVFTTEGIHLYCNQKKKLNPDPDKCPGWTRYVRAGSGKSVPGRVCPGGLVLENSSASHYNHVCKPVSVCELLRIENIGGRDAALRAEEGGAGSSPWGVVD